MVDEHAKDELDLYAENESSLYAQKKAILANLQRKVRAGKYNHALAPKLWMYWVESAAKKYAREFDDPKRWHKLFDVATRRALAKELADRYRGGQEG